MADEPVLSGSTTPYFRHWYSKFSSGLWSVFEERTYPVVSPLPEARPPLEPEIEPEPAEIIWGRASRFDYDPRNSPRIKYNVTVKDDNDDKDDKGEIPTLVYVEIDRKETPVRIPSQQNPDFWLEAAYVTEIAFEGPDSIKDPQKVHKRYQLKPPTTP